MSEIIITSVTFIDLSSNSYMKRSEWHSVRESVVCLANNFKKYSGYSSHQCEVAQANQAKMFCVATDVEGMKVFNREPHIAPALAKQYK